MARVVLADPLIDVIAPGESLASGGGKINAAVTSVNAMTSELYGATIAPPFVTFGAGATPDRLSFVSPSQFLNDTQSLRAVLKVRFSEAAPASTNQVLLSISDGGTANANQLLRLFFVSATRKLQLQIAAATAGTVGSYVYSSTTEVYTLLLSFDGVDLYNSTRGCLSVYDSTGAHIETIYGSGATSDTLALSTVREIAIGSLTPSHTATLTSFFQGDMGECRVWATKADSGIRLRGPVTYTGYKELGVDVAGQNTVRGITGADFINHRQYDINGLMYRLQSHTSTTLTFERPLASDFSGGSVGLYDSMISKMSGANEAVSSTSITNAVFNPANINGATFIWNSTTHTITGYNGTTLNFTPGLSLEFAAGISVAAMVGGSVRIPPPDLTNANTLTGVVYDTRRLTVNDILTIGADSYTVTSVGNTTISVVPALVADVATESVFTWVSSAEAHVHAALVSPPDAGGSLAGRRPLIYFGGTQTAAAWNAGTNQGTLGPLTMTGGVG